MIAGGVIGHEGVVEEFTSGKMKVSLHVEAACSACHSKSSCSAFDSKEKIIEINDISGEFKKGEMVYVKMKPSLGFRAVWLAYLVPFIVLIVSLLIFLMFGYNEGISGLMALSSVIVYYLILSQFKDALRKKFEFEVEKYLM